MRGTRCRGRPAFGRMTVMEITTLPEHLRPAAVELWAACGLTRPWNDPLADLVRAAEGPSSTVVGAVSDGQLLGTVMVGHDGHRGWVYYVAVDPAHRGRGLGRELMVAAEAWLLEREVPKLQFMVRADNTDVVAFYEHLGYADQNVTVLGRFLDADLDALRSWGS